MTISRTVAVIIIAGAGILGAFIARAVPFDAPRVQANTSASSTPSKSPPQAECVAERDSLASIKAKLAICIGNSETAPPDVPERPEPDATATVKSPVLEMFNSYHDRLNSLGEALIAQEADGTIGVYKPDEWHGDGLIIGRKFPNGQVGWYAGPDAGLRSDPSAFRPTNSTIILAPSFVREADGTIRVSPNAPPAVKRRFGAEDEGDAN